ncbi:MAG: TonB-dependent receptor, partial [Alphaproteobacteria bacterium]|nr:TonB-dependent receptor [Alphaproteobacteria bacterium]
MFKFRPISIMAATSVLAIATGAAAQMAPADITSQTASTDDIVVTGTLLRKAAPAGAQEFSISSQAISATDVQSSDQLLATIPQLSSFGTLQTGNQGGTQLTVNRTNLRNLPQGIGGSSPTLVLMDGHRIVGEGAKQSYPDPDVIPPALIERVDVLTDGGSASYGSDAVGGVINFITKKNFDGVDMGIRHGFGDHYNSTDANFTVGKSWGTGSAYIGYNYSAHSPILNADRGYVKDINWATGTPLGLSCSPGNVIANKTTYAVVGGNALAAGTGNQCNDAAFGDLYPKEIRHSVMAGFRQEMSSALEFDVKAYYSSRSDTSDNGPIQAQATVNSTSPLYIPTSTGNTASQTAYFNFAPLGYNGITTTKLWAYGITPTLTWKIGHDWQMNAYYNYGRSQTTAFNPGTNNTAINADVQAGTLNPYNISASNSAALAQVLNWTDYVIGQDTLSNAKVTFDGPVFKLPGGDVRVAVGGEYTYEKYAGTIQSGSFQSVVAAPLSPASRNVKAGFAEINIPLVGKDNHIPLIYSLTFSAAERYDDYSDFGTNWAPNLGVSWKPVHWINLRARWNKSFQAPSLVQLSQAATPTVTAFPGYFTLFDPALVNPAVAPNGGPIVAVQGTVSPLQPERARDYNLGFDLSPPMLDGLNLHFTYFNINYAGAIGTPPLGYGPFFGISSYTPYYQMLPSAAQVTTFLQNAGVPAAQIANVAA